MPTPFLPLVMSRDFHQTPAHVGFVRPQEMQRMRVFVAAANTLGFGSASVCTSLLVSELLGYAVCSICHLGNVGVPFGRLRCHTVCSRAGGLIFGLHLDVANLVLLLIECSGGTAVFANPAFAFLDADVHGIEPSTWLGSTPSFLGSAASMTSRQLRFSSPGIVTPGARLCRSQACI